MNAITTLPEILVEMDGAPLAVEDALALTELRVQQRLSVPTLCELSFFDPQGPLLTTAPRLPGSRLRVVRRGHLEPLFTGRVTAVEDVYGPTGERQVRVRGYDELHRLRQRQPVRAHVQVTLRDLARELVADLGLTVAAADSGPLWQKIIQYRQSDLDLLTELAERCGWYFTLRDQTLYLFSLEGFGEPLPLPLGESLLEARIEVNADPACQAVNVSAWDPGLARVRQGRATQARLNRMVAGVPPGRFHEAGERTLVDQIVQDAEQATALAQAELDRRRAHEVTLWGVAKGDPRLRPGSPVAIAGVAGALTGRYVLSEVTHTIDAQKGFISEISSAPPRPRPRRRETIAVLGMVSRVDDPDGLGRVRVALPTYAGLETDWLQVVVPGAGVGKGLSALPDVGDQVLVLLLDGDPAQGVVIGGLYGERGPPDTGVEGGAVRRYSFLTPGGQRIQLDDSGSRVRLENRAGSYVELAPDKVSVHAQTDLELAAPGQSVVIRGRAIDFQRG